MRNEGWDKSIFIQSTRPTFPTAEEIFMNCEIFPCNELLLRMITLSNIIRNIGAVPDGIILKLKTIGTKEPDMIEGDVSAYQLIGEPNPKLLKKAIRQLWHRPLSSEKGVVITIKQSSSLPIVDGEPIIVEIKLDKAKLKEPQTKAYKALINKGFKIIIIRVKILSLIENKFILELNF